MKRTTTPKRTKARARGHARVSWNAIRLTHPEKILYPEEGITKRMLAEYYVAVADWILPHVANRPLTLLRCPDGRAHGCFYQKNISQGMPPELDVVDIRQSNRTLHYAVVRDLPGLLGLVQSGVLEIHCWGCRDDRIEFPDRMVFDLDPDIAVPWARVVAAARDLKAFLDDLGLVSFLKTTGGKGLHLVAPLERKHSWEEVKRCAKAVAETFARQAPSEFTTNPLKAQRRDKIFLDYLRNSRGATFVAPYSTRAHAGAPVSTPLAWRELSARMRSDHFRLSNVPARLERLGHDPWADMANTRQSLSAKLLAAISPRHGQGR